MSAIYNAPHSQRLGLRGVVVALVVGTTIVAYATKAQAQRVTIERTTYRVTLVNIKCTQKSSKESGGEEEIYGSAKIQLIGANGRPLSVSRDVNVDASSPKGSAYPVFWSTSEKGKGAAGFLEMKSGKTIPLNRAVEYSLTERDLARGKVKFIGHLYEADPSPNKDDDLGAKTIEYELKNGINSSIVMTFVGPGKGKVPTKAQFQFAVTKADPISQTLVLKATPSVDRSTGLAVCSHGVTPLDIDFPKLGTQTPFFHVVAVPTLKRGTTGQKFVHLSLKGTTFSASRNGIIDINTEKTRGFFLEKAVIGFNPQGLKLVSNGPHTTALGGTATSTAGVDLGTGLEIAKEPSMSLTAGLNFGTSYSQTLKDFTVDNVGGSKDLQHTYKMAQAEGKPYKKAHDLLVDKSVQLKGIQLRNVPDLATKNFPIISQAVYVVPENMNNQKIKFRVRLTMYLRWADVKTDNVTYNSNSEGVICEQDILIPIDLSQLK